MPRKIEKSVTTSDKWKQKHMSRTLGDDSDEVNQVFDLYDEISKMLSRYTSKRGDEGFNLMCLATAIGMTLNDISDEIEDDAPDSSVREDVAGRVVKFIFVNKRMVGH